METANALVCHKFGVFVFGLVVGAALFWRLPTAYKVYKQHIDEGMNLKDSLLAALYAFWGYTSGR